MIMRTPRPTRTSTLLPYTTLVLSQTLGDMNAAIGAIGKTTETYTGMDLFYCMMVGLGVTGMLVWITEYYTGTNYHQVRSIAKSSETGHGTNVIQGLAVSLESNAMPTIVICVGIIVKIGTASGRERECQYV